MKLKLGNLFKGDKVIWIIFVALTIISAIAVYTSIGRAAIASDSSPFSAFLKHLVFIGAAYVIVILVSNLRYTAWSKLSIGLYWISFALLLYVAIFCKDRWISIPDFGSFQPSELAKVSLIAYIANLMTINRDQLDELSFFIKVWFFVLLIAVPILPGNFSTAALVLLTAFVLLFFGGINKKYMLRTLLVIVAGVGIGLAVCVSSYQNGTTGDGIFARAATWGHRIDTFLHPDPNELTQENMARMAIASGGFTGSGVSHTVHSRLMTQAENDFIFAIIIEEAGVFAALFIFFLYSWLYFRCIKMANRCSGHFGSLLLIGYGSLIYFQALVNMGVAVCIIPVTGQTLPLISDGGSAYLCMAIAIGIIQSVCYETNKEYKEIKDKRKSDKEFEELKKLNAQVHGTIK